MQAHTPTPRPSPAVKYLIANYPLGHPSITLGTHRDISPPPPHTATLLIGWPLNLGAESLLQSHAGPDISAAGREHSTLLDNYWHGRFPRANIIRSGIGGRGGQHVLSHLEWLAGVGGRRRRHELICLFSLPSTSKENITQVWFHSQTTVTGLTLLTYNKSVEWNEVGVRFN